MRMDEARFIKVVRLGKTLLAGLLLVALAIVFALFLGKLVVSPNWQDAVRLVAIGGLIVVILMSPVNGLLLWIIVAPYALAHHTTLWHILNIRLPPGIPDLSLARLAVATLSVVWVAQLAIGKKKMRRLGAVEVFMVMFCIAVLPSAAAGLAGINRSVQVLFDKFITPFLVFALAKNLYEEKTGLDKLGLALAVIGIYLSFMVFYESLTGQPLVSNLGAIGGTPSYTRSLPKVVSLLGSPAFLATVLGMVVPIALYKLVRERSPYARAFYGALFLAALLGNFFCYNRGAWLALVVGLFIMLLCAWEYRRILLPILLIAAVVGLVYWQVISESAVATERLSNVSSLRFRLTMLEASEKMIRNDLLFGVGLGNFAHYFLEYGGYWPTLAYDQPTPHNSYVLVLSTMGLVSFIPYVLIFTSMFLEMWPIFGRSREASRVDRAFLVSG